MDKPKINTKVVEILAEQFHLSFEQAKELYILYRLCGSADAGIVAAFQYLDSEKPDWEIGLEVIKQVFYALDDLRDIIEKGKKEEEELRKWWETGEMGEPPT